MSRLYFCKWALLMNHQRKSASFHPAIIARQKKKQRPSQNSWKQKPSSQQDRKRIRGHHRNNRNYRNRNHYSKTEKEMERKARERKQRQLMKIMDWSTMIIIGARKKCWIVKCFHQSASTSWTYLVVVGDSYHQGKAMFSFYSS